MNRTKIEWTDFTWNPISGCSRTCDYCYARRMAYRLKGRAGYPIDDPFKPTYHKNRLSDPCKIRKSSMIFTCSMGEFFDPQVPEEWREEVYKVIETNPHHIFQILSKQLILQPRDRYEFPSNLWLGVSIDGTSDYWEEPIQTLRSVKNNIKFISFEPILGDILPKEYSYVDWVIIGAQTGPGAKRPDEDIVRRIVNKTLSTNLPLFIKPNIKKYFPQDDWIHREDFPKRREN